MSEEEQARINEINGAFSVPANVGLMGQLVDGFNYLYDQNEGLNMIVQVHSREDQNGRSWVAIIEDNYSFPGKVIQVKVHPDKTIDAPILIDNHED